MKVRYILKTENYCDSSQDREVELEVDKCWTDITCPILIENEIAQLVKNRKFHKVLLYIEAEYNKRNRIVKYRELITAYTLADEKEVKDAVSSIWRITAINSLCLKKEIFFLKCFLMGCK